MVARARTRRDNVPEAPAALDGPIEAGGAILEVPLVQDDLLDDEIVRRDEAGDDDEGAATGLGERGRLPR
jgi:hypothetical protein